jgi:hypothetical protein
MLFFGRVSLWSALMSQIIFQRNTIKLLFTVLLFSICRLAIAQGDVIATWNNAAVAAGYRAQLTLVPNTRNVAVV